MPTATHIAGDYAVPLSEEELAVLTTDLSILAKRLDRNIEFGYSVPSVDAQDPYAVLFRAEAPILTIYFSYNLSVKRAFCTTMFDTETRKYTGNGCSFLCDPNMSTNMRSALVSSGYPEHPDVYPVGYYKLADRLYLPFLPMFDEASAVKYTDEGLWISNPDVNEAKEGFFRLLESLCGKEPADTNPGLTRYVKTRADTMQQQFESVIRNISTADNLIRTSLQTMRKANNDLTFYTTIRDNYEKKNAEGNSIFTEIYKAEYDALTRFSNSNAISKLWLEQNKLYIKTGAVKITKFSSGYVYEFGPFIAEIDLDTGKLLTVKPTDYEECLHSGGIYHPHVNDLGVPCLGDADIQIRTAVGSFNFTDIVCAVLNYLGSYNSDSPYRKLNEFSRGDDDDDVDDDGDDVESCAEDNAGTRECVSCDRDCEYRDEAGDSCWEHVSDNDDFEECIRCGSCNHSSDAEIACQENSSSEDDCMRDCRVSSCWHYRDSDDCFGQAEQLEQCLGSCSNDHCSHHRNYDECPDYELHTEEVCLYCDVDGCPRHIYYEELSDESDNETEDAVTAVPIVDTPEAPKETVEAAPMGSVEPTSVLEVPGELPPEQEVSAASSTVTAELGNICAYRVEVPTHQLCSACDIACNHRINQTGV